MLITQSIFHDENVVVTGNPRYDVFIHLRDQKLKDDIVKRYKLPVNKKYLLWAPAFRALKSGEDIKTIEAFNRCAAAIEDLILVIKPHPGDTPKRINFIRKHLKNGFWFKIKADLSFNPQSGSSMSRT